MDGVRVWQLRVQVRPCLHRRRPAYYRKRGSVSYIIGNAEAFPIIGNAEAFPILCVRYIR